MADIEGAKARTLAGHTASGIAIDRTRPHNVAWPYAVAFASDTQEIGDVPPLPRGLGASGNFETPAVETHLGTPGVNLVVRRKPLEPLIVPPPRLTLGPLRSIYDLYEEGLLPTAEAQERRRRQAPPPPRDPSAVPPPRWAKPALDTPQAPDVLDRSLSTNDISGAKPRRLVSVEARHAGLRRAAPKASVAWPRPGGPSFF